MNGRFLFDDPLIEDIRNNRYIMPSLDLQNEGIEEKEWDENGISDALSKNTHIERLRLSSNYLSSTQLQRLANDIKIGQIQGKSFRQLTRLEMNYYGQIDAVILMTLFKHQLFVI